MNDDGDTGINGKSAAVYVGWATFKSCILEGLTHGGLPNTINRSVFPGQSGGVQAQLLSSLKFLDLTDEKGKPTKALHDLTVPDESARKQALEAILRARYAAIFDLGIERTTMDELTKTMADSYGVSGDTKGKAVRFFLGAAQYAGIPLSAYLLKASGGTNGRRRTRRARTGDPTPAPAAPPQFSATPQSTPAGGSQHTISLVSGGSVTIAVSLDMFKLTPEDRAFVFGLIDKLTEYEKKNRVEDDDEKEEEDEVEFDDFGSKPKSKSRP
jgi:hypothetical protein